MESLKKTGEPSRVVCGRAALTHPRSYFQLEEVKTSKYQNSLESLLAQVCLADPPHV
jgi:hypothetical protein